MALPVIQFDRELFFSGQFVTGRVTLSIASDQPALRYNVKFLGKTAIFSFLYSDYDCPELQKEETKAQQIHVEQNQVLWIAEKGVNIIPSGTYIWPFSFALPIDCPSSFEGKYGFIRYGIQVLVDKPKGKSFTVDSPISVAFLVNLNLIPKEVTNWKFNKDKVVLTVNPPAGAVSGETILITGLIENNHKETKITGMKASFHQIVTFRRDSKYTDKPLSVYETKKKELQMHRQEFKVVGGYSREFSLSFEVPPVVATIRNSKYLSVEYVLRFSTKDEIYGWSMDKREVCVLIGNVPRVAEGSSGGPPYTLIEADISLNKTDRFPFVPVFPYYGGLGK